MNSTDSDILEFGETSKLLEASVQTTCQYVRSEETRNSCSVLAPPDPSSSSSRLLCAQETDQYGPHQWVPLSSEFWEVHPFLQSLDLGWPGDVLWPMNVAQVMKRQFQAFIHSLLGPCPAPV
ncbi:uncharacterized protein LOC144301100 [Canis aureus]